MRDELARFLSKHLEIDDGLEAALSDASLTRSYPKGAILLREGEVARLSYFILRGCVRSYVLKEGVDITLAFYVEEDPVLPIGYGSGEPSGHFLECVEDTVAVASSPELEASTLVRHPELKAACLAMSELMAAKLQESLARYRALSAEERYEDLATRRPDLLQRIPQYQIASYLGVRPESLSRIRRRLSVKRRPA